MHKVRMVLTQSSSIEPRGVFISYPAKSCRHSLGTWESIGAAFDDLSQRPMNVHGNRISLGCRKAHRHKMPPSLKPPSGRLKVSRTLTCDAPRRRQDDLGHLQKFHTAVHSLSSLRLPMHSPGASKRSPKQRWPAWTGSGEPPAASKRAFSEVIAIRLRVDWGSRPSERGAVVPGAKNQS